MSSPSDSPVLIVTGPPGVGKTTTAAILAGRRSPAVHLEADTFFRFIHSGYVEPWKPESREQNEVVMRIVAEAAAGYAGGGYFTIIDGIVIPEWFLEPVSDALRDAGHRVAYAVLRAPFAVCRARLQGRESVPLAEPETIERLWRSFDDLGELKRHAVDLDGRTPDEAADLLARRLADGLLAV